MLSDGALRYRVGMHKRQQEAFNTEATELLFGGASRGGKSHFVRAALITWCLEIPGLQCKIFRKFSEDVIANHMESETGFKVMLEPLIRAKLVEVVKTEVRFLCNGSLISLHHCQDDDLGKYQGRGTHVLVLDEATQLSERIIKFLRGWCTMTTEMQARLPDKYKGKFPRVIYTANPIGVTVGYFRREFVKARPAFSIEKVGAWKRQYIPSLVQDNPSEDAQAAKDRLGDIGDAGMAEALIGGNWDAPTGDYFPQYDEKRHVIPNFTPPEHWFRFRTFDWGRAEPFACYWWAVSDGESFEVNLQIEEDGILVPKSMKLWFPRGALLCYREWYGCYRGIDEKTGNRVTLPGKGCEMSNEDMAKGILARSPLSCEKNIDTLTDSYVFPDRGETDGQTIAKTFADNGVVLTLGRTKRVAGWSQMGQRLIGKKFDTNADKRIAMLFIMEQCKFLREYIPALPRHPNEAKREDAAEHGEATHACDAARLACMAHEIVNDAPAADAYSQNLESDEPGLKFQPTIEDALKRAKQIRLRGDGARY